MIKENFNEKVALILSLLIFSNYLLLAFNFSEIFLKINFIFFLLVLLLYYFKFFLDNIYLKIFFLFIIFISLGTPTFEWDPRSIWLFHAKRIFYDFSIFSISDNYAPFSHNDYPNLVPAFASSLATLVGHWNEIFPKIAFSLIFLPPLILSYSLLKETKYLIFLSLVFFVIGKYLFNGWADGLLAIYFTLSAFLMYLIIFKNDKKKDFSNNSLYKSLALSFFILLTLIKNEGIALLLVIFLTTFLITLFKGDLKKNTYNLFFLSLSFIPIIMWKSFCYANEIGNDYINTELLSHFLPRFNDLDNYVQIAYFLFLNEKFIFCLIFFLIIFFINPNKDLLIYVSILTTSYSIILFFIFLSTPTDFYFQLNSAAARIIKSLSFLLAFFGVYNLKLKV